MPGSDLDTDKVKMRKTWSLGRILSWMKAREQGRFCFLCLKPSKGFPLLLE